MAVQMELSEVEAVPDPESEPKPEELPRPDRPHLRAVGNGSCVAAKSNELLPDPETACSHDVYCDECGSHVTISPSGTEYGHVRACDHYDGPDADPTLSRETITDAVRDALLEVDSGDVVTADEIAAGTEQDAGPVGQQLSALAKAEPDGPSIDGTTVDRRTFDRRSREYTVTHAAAGRGEESC